MAEGKKVIFVLVDGLSAAAARCMGYMASLVQDKKARGASMICELPPLSRPLYQCIFTGRTPQQSGIVHNTQWTPPTPAERAAHPDIFSRASAAGLVTAAAAYHYVSELCNAAPFDPVWDRLRLHADMPIQHGMFYCRDDYPDEQLLLDAEMLRTRYTPHLLFVHTMGVDHAGHCHGGNSTQYRNAARELDILLARFMPLWLEEGYAVIVTSDHGMSPDAHHNDLTPDVRRVPQWLAGTGVENVELPRSQTQWCGVVCQLLGI